MTDHPGLSEQRAPFQREERFIVVKRKHLTPAKEDRLRDHLFADEIETVECVVVESDWPEYETVWAMIEARCTGTPLAIADQRARALAMLADKIVGSEHVKLAVRAGDFTVVRSLAAEDVIDLMLAFAQPPASGVDRSLVIAMEDFLNEPPRTWDIEPMEVRDYRHQAYRVWEPLCRAILALTNSGAPVPGENFAATLQRIGAQIDGGEAAGAITRIIDGKRYVVLPYETYEGDLMRRFERGKAAALKAAKPVPGDAGGVLREAVFERDDACNVEFGTVPDCDCPHEHWHVNGVCLDVHIEEDRSGHIILTLEDDPIELQISGVADISEARTIAFAWAAKKLGLAHAAPAPGAERICREAAQWELAQAATPGIGKKAADNHRGAAHALEMAADKIAAHAAPAPSDEAAQP